MSISLTDWSRERIPVHGRHGTRHGSGTGMGVEDLLVPVTLLERSAELLSSSSGSLIRKKSYISSF